MFRAALLALLTVLPLPAAALDLSNMTDAERAAFRAEVRAYLLENPEVLEEAIAVLNRHHDQQQAKDDAQLVADNHAALFEDPNSWVGGNPDGDVTLVEFMDYKCGYCKKAAPDVANLLSSDGRIRYVVKEFPILGDQSVLGARFAIAVKRIAGDDAYGKVHAELMDFRGEITDASLRALAKRQGLDVEAVMAGMTDPATDQVIAANHRLAAILQINGTPGFIFQDQLVRGYVPLDAMQQIVANLRS